MYSRLDRGDVFMVLNAVHRVNYDLHLEGRENEDIEDDDWLDMVHNKLKIVNPDKVTMR